MRGDLEQINLADIFQTLALSKMEGMLRVRNPLEQREIFFREGLVRCMVPARVEVRRLGQMLIRAGVISTEQLRSALLTKKKVRKPVGQILIEEGVVTEDQVEEIAHRQITEDLYSLFTWKHGSFEFYRGPCADPLLAQRLDQLPEYDVSGVLVEVARRCDEWALILESLRSLDEIPVATGAGDASKLSRDQQIVLRAADGQLNIRELADAALMGLFDCARIVKDFYDQGVLQPASTQQVVDVAQGWLSRGEMKRALVTVQTLYDRTDAHDMETIIVVADVLKRSGESHMASSVLLEAAQQETEADKALELIRQARALDPRNPEVLTLLHQSLKQSKESSREELVNVTAALIDALRDDGQLEDALLMVNELETLQPGGSVVLTRKARLLHRLKRPADAIETLQALATLYSQQKQREQLIGVYEQILKIDHGRKDVARALKKLHAGRLGGLRRLCMTTGAILVAAAIGGWVFQGKLMTTALELLRIDVSNHLIAGDTQAALERVHQHELAHGLSEELIHIRASVDAAIRDWENQVRTAALEEWQEGLAEAGELMNRGRCVEAMAVYERLEREAPAQLRVIEAMQARMSSLIARLEKLEEKLRPAIPPPPGDVSAIDVTETALAALDEDFNNQDLQMSRGILETESDENFVSLVAEEDRTRLLKSAHAIVEVFEEARRRRSQLIAWLDDARTATGLQSVFQKAQAAAKAGDFPEALQHYRTLMEKYPLGGGLAQRFKDRVKYYSTIIRYLKIIKRATAEGSFAKARNQYRTLKREFPDEKFPMVRLPVRVETTPKGARIHVNGEERGISPLKLAYSPIQSTRIRVELDGFYPEEAVLDGDAHEKVVSLLARVPDWTVKVSGAVGYDPVVDGDGRVFIVDRSGTVTALEGRTGDVIWSLDTKDLSGLLPKPVVHGDRLVVASVDGTLRSLDRRTGKVRWQEDGLPTELAPVIAGSTIVIVSSKNELVGVHSGTGEVTFTVSLPGDVQVSPITVQGRYILTVTTDGVVRKFDSRNGQSLWTQDGIAGRGVLSTPTITTHGVVIPAEDGSLTLLDTQTGGQLWKQTRLGAVSLSVAHRGNVLYLAQENRVLSRSVKDGRALTSMTAERPWTSPPTLLGDSLLVGNRAGQMFVLDAESLAPRYQILSKGRIVVTPVLLSNGVIVVAYENGNILGFLE